MARGRSAETIREQSLYWNTMSDPLEVPIILIPLIWLAAATLVVAACQVAARADACSASYALGEEAPNERGAVDQHRAPGRIDPQHEHAATGRGRGAIVHDGR